MKKKARDFVYLVLHPFLSFKWFRKLVSSIHNFGKQYEEAAICKAVSRNNTVISGPFKGLKYAVSEAAGSALIPKIIGSYEDELHEVIEKICEKNFTAIIDIGCAEGYYANGFAMRIPAAKVTAYDMDENARLLCRKNALANGLQERIIIEPFINEEILTAYPFPGKGLVICDCEGYEKELFTKRSVKNLGNCDLIIELHDCNDDSISKTLLPLFENTHELTLIKSNPQKKVGNYPILQNITIPITDEMLDERRGIIMYWAFLETNKLKQ